MTVRDKQVSNYNAPLKLKDTITKTEGCRHSNPDICGNNSLHNICAFVRKDGMCLKPPSSWPRKFEQLKKSGSKRK